MPFVSSRFARSPGVLYLPLAGVLLVSVVFLGVLCHVCVFCPSFAIAVSPRFTFLFFSGPAPVLHPPASAVLAGRRPHAAALMAAALLLGLPASLSDLKPALQAELSLIAADHPGLAFGLGWSGAGATLPSASRLTYLAAPAPQTAAEVRFPGPQRSILRLASEAMPI